MYTTTFSLLALIGTAQAHMSMFFPAPLGSAPSINTQSTTLDKQFNFPLGDGGERGPGLCRGHLDKFDTEQAQVTWQAGQDAHFQLTDFTYDPNAVGSTHWGGSCQVGFSVDKGKTWKVAASYHGACPHHTEDGSPEAQTFDFKVPTGMPEGDALFMWLWLNREHESFSNCAKVKISAGSGSPPAQPAPSSQFSAPPAATSKITSPPAATSKVVAPPAQTSKSYAAPPAATPSPHAQPTPSANPVPDNDDCDDDSDVHWWRHNREHKKVDPNARRYIVDGYNCECRRTPGNSRCACDASTEERATIERKALRMHRRTLYKRVDACDWATAPTMQVSYFTSDATCAPGAKGRMPESDKFELSWDVKCGVVEDSKHEYELKLMECGMYGA
jgi:hypothetical protein